MNLPDDEIRRRILTILDRYYGEDFECVVSPDQLAEELNLNRPTVDQHLRALQGRGLVQISGETIGGHYYAQLTPDGKDEWDRRRGNQYHFVLRRRMLGRIKEIDDQEEGQFTTSDGLAADLEVEQNDIFINLVYLEQQGWVELQWMMVGRPFCHLRLTPGGQAVAEEPPVDINFCFALMPFETSFDPV
ncbi:MAG: winged helix-turn-helix domain-containing protein, partial [Fidelibacterota bacterium]